MVPVVGLEPTRGISPTDFESVTSTNSITPAEIQFLHDMERILHSMLSDYTIFPRVCQFCCEESLFSDSSP